MSEKFDGKFHGIIVKNKDGSVVPQDQWMVFLIKDDAFPATLRFYRAECERQEAGPEQLKAVDEAIERMDLWRERNAHLCKTPDVQPGEIVT